ncbi:MAG: GTP cyclohydrolase II [Pseudomonadota bacterium]
MAVTIHISDRIARARADLRLGLPVIIGEALVWSIEAMSVARFQEAMALKGEPYIALTRRRAETLKIRAYDGDLARVRLPADADLGLLHAIGDPSQDLYHPMKGPLKSLRDGDAQVGRLATQLMKTARLLPAALVLEGIGVQEGLTQLQCAPLGEALAQVADLAPAIAARVPLAVGASRVHVFRPGDGADEHYAIEIGQPDRQSPVLTRLHSACFTGDLMGSLKCDCGAQLQAALTRMGQEGAGVLLYLNQEGRGIGLANKMRAYALQDQGFDTVEANHRLGFEDDERDFTIGAKILKEMGFSSVRLLTNNPAKVDRLASFGLDVVERVPLIVEKTQENSAYLATKAAKSGHIL